MSLEPVQTPGTPATAQPRLLRMSPRRVVAGVVFTFAAGFIVGFWFHQPTKPHDYTATLAAIQTAQAETDRLLAEQRRILNCVPVGDEAAVAAASAATPAQPKHPPQKAKP